MKKRLFWGGVGGHKEYINESYLEMNISYLKVFFLLLLLICLHFVLYNIYKSKRTNMLKMTYKKNFELPYLIVLQNNLSFTENNAAKGLISTYHSLLNFQINREPVSKFRVPL